MDWLKSNVPLNYMQKSKMQSLLLLQQVTHTDANGLGFNLCPDGANAFMCQEIMLKDSDSDT